jgi:hypothetical protein
MKGRKRSGKINVNARDAAAAGAAENFARADESGGERGAEKRGTVSGLDGARARRSVANPYLSCLMV